MKNTRFILAANACRAGFTFIENVVAMGIVVLGFSALYAINTQCLYLVNASREAFDAGQAMQDRIEQVRNCTWGQITDPTYIANSVLNSQGSNAAPLKTITETFTINSYPTAVSPAIQVTRTNGVVSVVSTNSAVASGDLVKIDLQMTWSQGPKLRDRTMAASTIWGEKSR